MTESARQSRTIFPTVHRTHILDKALQDIKDEAQEGRSKRVSFIGHQEVEIYKIENKDMGNVKRVGMEDRQE